MAKALLGYLGPGADPQMTAQVRRLQERVRQLELEVARLRAVNDDLLTTVAVERDLLTLSAHEPALT